MNNLSSDEEAAQSDYESGSNYKAQADNENEGENDEN